MEVVMRPYIETYDDGTQVWYLNGKIHREDAPAIIGSDGCQLWYLNDKCHREDGPAIIWPDGTQRWYLNGKNITKEITNWANERNIDLNNMSDFDKMILKTELRVWEYIFNK
jgi:hypothetical protein